tara:strand:+ start:106 stop:291 length:186 start_codon:yes stop_codon:yes gene_type:complete
MSNNKENIEFKKEKCPYCKKKTVSFYLHECKRAIQEYYGCNTCDNWCTNCKANWSNDDKKE